MLMMSECECVPDDDDEDYPYLLPNGIQFNGTEKKPSQYYFRPPSSHCLASSLLVY